MKYHHPVIFTFPLSALTFWSLTWSKVIEVVVSSIRQVPGEGAGVNFGWRGGTVAQRKPPMKQILLLHPDNLLVLCWGKVQKEERGKCYFDRKVAACICPSNVRIYISSKRFLLPPRILFLLIQFTLYFLLYHKQSSKPNETSLCSFICLNLHPFTLLPH